MTAAKQATESYFTVKLATDCTATSFQNLMAYGGSSGAEVGSHKSVYYVIRQQYFSIQTIFFKNLNFLKIFSVEFSLFSVSILYLHST